MVIHDRPPEPETPPAEKTASARVAEDAAAAAKPADSLQLDLFRRGGLSQRPLQFPLMDENAQPGDVARIRHEVQVMFFDTDCAAVVHNIAYLRFIETARTLLAGQLGMSLAEMARRQEYPVVVRTEIDYKRPAVLGDHLIVDGWLERVERIRFWCAFTITRKDDPTVLIRCRQMLALVQMPSGRPIRLSEEWHARYGHLAGGVPSDEGSASRMHGGQVDV